MKDWGDIIMLMVGASSLVLGRIFHYFFPGQSAKFLFFLLLSRFIFYPIFIL
jgi:hypothetical protein